MGHKANVTQSLKSEDSIYVVAGRMESLSYKIGNAPLHFKMLQVKVGDAEAVVIKL